MRILVLAVCALALGTVSAAAQMRDYRVLATSRTSTMQEEMRQAGDAGFRFVAAMGGETAIGGREVVVIMEKARGDSVRYEYLLLAANRTSTLQKELQESADAGYQIVGQTVFQSTFGGRETSAILERGPSGADTVRYEYKLLATSRTSTMQKELQELAAEGFVATGLTVGETALGGNELVVITRRRVP
jgi:hypothetical protein